MDRSAWTNFASPPRRDKVEEMLVRPWSGVICNIQGTLPSGVVNLPGGLEILEFFRVFNPQNVQVMRGGISTTNGNLGGMAIVQFRPDLKGFRDATAFEKYFLERKQGREHWIANQGAGGSLYGWLARGEDYHDDVFSRYLKATAELVELQSVTDEMEEAHKQMLAKTLTEKNKETECLSQKLEETQKEVQNEIKRAANCKRDANVAKESTVCYTEFGMKIANDCYGCADKLRKSKKRRGDYDQLVQVDESDSNTTAVEDEVERRSNSADAENASGANFSAAENESEANFAAAKDDDVAEDAAEDVAEDEKDAGEDVWEDEEDVGDDEDEDGAEDVCENEEDAGEDVWENEDDIAEHAWENEDDIAENAWENDEYAGEDVGEDKDGTEDVWENDENAGEDIWEDEDVGEDKDAGENEDDGGEDVGENADGAGEDVGEDEDAGEDSGEDVWEDAAEYLREDAEEDEDQDAWED